MFAASKEQSTLRKIGKYEVLGALGRGSMGVVYKARDPEIGRMVAIKTLRTVQSNQFHSVDAAVERFMREARSAGNLRHPNIITIFEVSRDGELPYLVMDYLEGESLEALVLTRGRLDPRIVIPYAKQIANGLDHAHARGIVHRDIKPSNLMIDRNGVAFVLDFGVATISETFAAGALNGTAEISASSPIIGTPGYMSPEQILNHPLDHRTDIFSFAAVIFECLSGKRPFPGETFNDVISNILAGKPLSITSLVAEFPLAVEAEFDRALAHERDKRFRNCREMVDSIAKAFGLESLQSSDASNPFNLPDLPRRRSSSGWKSFKSVAVQGAEQSGQAKLRSGAKAAKTSGGNMSTVNDYSASQTNCQHFDSVETFNPWAESRPIGHKFTDNARPKSGDSHRNPGDMFAVYDGFQKQVKITAPASDTAAIRRLTIIFSGLCVALGSILLLLLFGQDAAKNPSYPRPQTEVRVGVARSQPARLDVQRPKSVNLALPEVDPVPDGVPVSEMSDKQILGVLVDKRSSEWNALMALREAEVRRLSKFVEASQVALNHDSLQVRVKTIEILAALGDKRAVSLLLLRLDDPESAVRGHAARALGRLGDSSAVGYLTVRHGKEQDAVVKVTLKRSIERITGLPFNEQ